MTLTMGALFAGYEGIGLGIRQVFGDVDLAWYSEIEPAACTVLAAHHPGVPNLGDITAVDWADVPPVDVLTGGYPCQPFSHAGKRKGTNDERHLWPYVRDAIRVLRPRITVLENVRGHLTLGFDTVLADLAELGLSARWGVVRAADAGAPHGRARLFMVVAEDTARWAGGAGAGWGVSESTRSIRLAASNGRHLASNPVSERHDRTGDRQGEECQKRRWSHVDGHPQPAADTYGPAGQERDFGTEARRNLQQRHDSPGPRVRRDIDWGRYAPAVNNWERVLGRPAPSPTVPGASGRPRLSPAFVEWMMGLPAGHVTGHGLRPAQELKMLGNGVVPQQAALALRMLGVAP